MTEASGDDLATLMQDRFGFLADLAFAVTSVHDGAVVWRSGDRQVTVARDWRDGLVDVTFSRGESGAYVEGFGLQQGLEAVGKGELWPAHGWQAYPPELSRTYVEELALLTAAAAPELLAPGSAKWAEAASAARARARAYQAQLTSEQARRRAEAAWQGRDWPTVIAQYEAIESAGVPLSASEQKRIEYARKRL